MELKEALANRRSIRKFENEIIPEETIKRIIEAGMLAPSASNRQLCEFVVVNDRGVQEKIYREAGAQKIILNAPVSIITLYDTRFNVDHCANIQSASAAVENIFLKIHELGLGGCWVAGFGDEKVISRILKIPPYLKPLCLIMVGKPAEFPTPPAKRGLEEILHFNVYSTRKKALPFTIHPSKCSWGQIRRHQQFLSRSSYLGKDYEIYADGEIEKISEIIKKNVKNENMTILNLYGYDGTLLRRLSPVLAGQILIDVELSKEACNFVRYKISFPRFLVCVKDISLPSNSIDLILYLFSLERVPAIEELLRESSRLLKEGGKIIIFLKNKFSFYGLMYYFLEKIMGVRDVERFFLSSGPFEPLCPARVKKIMRNLKISVSEQGLYLLPLELGIYGERVNGYLKRHGRRLSFFKFFVKPIIYLLNLALRLTLRVTLPSISSSVCLIGTKEGSGKREDAE